jgi:hypothetical protein
MKYELEEFHRNVSEGELLADLTRVASELGKSRVTIDEYNDRGAFHSTTLARRFGSWFAATDKAGLCRTRNLNIPSEDLFANLVDLWTALGRQPRYSDLRPGASRFSSGTYEKRFGGWTKALQAFVVWANEGDLVPPQAESVVGSGRKTPRNINWRLRALVLMRDGARCRLCGATPHDGIRLHVDHIKPWSKGGETLLENLQILCNICNIGKSDLEFDPETS